MRGLGFLASATLFLCLASLPARAGEVGAGQVDQGDMRPALGLMGTVPLFWGEADGLSDLLTEDHRGHWARPILEERHDLVPLDYLSPEALLPLKHLLLAQPRGLTAEENVALDAWVRDGGRLLLFIDPYMTGESRFAIGDRRRPQDVALLSPILMHWGLDLRFDAESEEGLEMREIAGSGVPVNLPGHFTFTRDNTGCAAFSAGLLVRCPIGNGEVVALADAAVLDLAGPWEGAGDSLRMLDALAFGEGAE